jgi:DNA-binding winged helix-turn-helix (wHTH) protein
MQTISILGGAAAAARVDAQPFEIDFAGGRLRRSGKSVDLPPKAFLVLQYLVDHAGQLISKERLLGTIWGDVHVEEAVLKVAICQVRKALDDSIREPRFIETAHRRGYRFIGKIASATCPAPSTRHAGRTAARIISDADAIQAWEASRALASRLQGGGQLQLRISSDSYQDGGVKLPSLAVGLLARLLDEMARGQLLQMEVDAMSPEAA